MLEKEISLLATYLPSAPLARLDYRDGHLVEQVRLLGLTLPVQGKEVGRTARVAFLDENGQQTMARWVDAAKLKLYLRPFSHLVLPLPDGSVPALEVARLALADYEPAAFHLAYELFSDRVTVTYSLLNSESRKVMGIFSDFTLSDEAEYVLNQVAIIDYLRFNLFALPVQGHPLVEGQDYLALV